jgi:ribosome maturation factor RimP
MGFTIKIAGEVFALTFFYAKNFITRKLMQENNFTIIKNYIEQEGFKLAFHDFSLGDNNKTYKFFIENTDLTPVSISQLEKLHKYLRTVLFAENIISENTRIELSSPGMDRPLFTHEDYLRFIGSGARLSLKQEVNGSKKPSGKITEVTSDVITLETKESGCIKVNFDNIKSAHLLPFYEEANVKKTNTPKINIKKKK